MSGLCYNQHNQWINVLKMLDSILSRLNERKEYLFVYYFFCFNIASGRERTKEEGKWGGDYVQSTLYAYVKME
jgi:hypothetical protein